MNDETFFCLALSLVPGVGTGDIHPPLRQCGSASDVFAISRSELPRLRLSSEAGHTIGGGFAQKSAEEALQSAGSKKIKVLSPFERAYPDLLKQIFDPPLVLYYLGAPEYLEAQRSALAYTRYRVAKSLGNWPEVFPHGV